MAALLAAIAAPVAIAQPALAGERAATSEAFDLVRLLETTPAGDPLPLEEAARGIDPDSPEAAVLRARIAAMKLRDEEVRSALADFAGGGGHPPARLAEALAIEADAAFANGDYAAAAAALARQIPLLETLGRDGRAASSRQALGIAALLAGEPRQRLVGGSPEAIATVRDKVGLTRASVAINGQMQEAVFDTGANLSVINESAARRLSLRMIEGDASVGSSTSAAVATRLAIAETLVIAGMELRDVVFLVMADEQLEFPVPGGYRIDAIVGFPVFRALGRITFDRAGTFTPGGPELPGSPNLFVDGSDLYVLARINGARAALHLDTGASSTSLTTLFARREDGLVAGLPRETRQVAGAGGTVGQEVAIWDAARVSIDGREVTLPRIDIAVTDAVTGPSAEEVEALGTLGQDVLRAFPSYSLDFRTMRFAFGRPAGS